MTRKKPSDRVNSAAHSGVETGSTAECPSCEALERQYENAISHIHEVLARRFKNIDEKVRELHRWQEKRDDAIEAFYSHKQRHCEQSHNRQRTTAA